MVEAAFQENVCRPAISIGPHDFGSFSLQLRECLIDTETCTSPETTTSANHVPRMGFLDLISTDSSVTAQRYLTDEELDRVVKETAGDGTSCGPSERKAIASVIREQHQAIIQSARSRVYDKFPGIDQPGGGLYCSSSTPLASNQTPKTLSNERTLCKLGFERMMFVLIVVLTRRRYPAVRAEACWRDFDKFLQVHSPRSLTPRPLSLTSMSADLPPFDGYASAFSLSLCPSRLLLASIAPPSAPSRPTFTDSVSAQCVSYGTAAGVSSFTDASGAAIMGELYQARSTTSRCEQYNLPGTDAAPGR